MTKACRHTRFETISQDENGKFVECLDCREIFESGELDDQASAQRGAEQTGEHIEDLSDA
jgi:hypothetical protein